MNFEVAGADQVHQENVKIILSIIKSRSDQFSSWTCAHWFDGVWDENVVRFEVLLIVCPLHDEDILDGRTLVVLQSFRNRFSQRNSFSASNALVGGHDCDGRHVLEEEK